jgi:2-keto-4-pentenoate hydratase
LTGHAAIIEDYSDHLASGAFVLGSPVEDWSSIDFATMAVSVRQGVKTIVETIAGRIAVNPFLPVVILANELRDRHGLKSGQFVATASFASRPIASKEGVIATFEGIGDIELVFG